MIHSLYFIMLFTVFVRQAIERYVAEFSDEIDATNLEIEHQYSSHH